MNRGEPLVGAMTGAAGEGDLARPLEFRFYYFTRRYDETVAFYRDVLQLQVHRSWDHGPEARGTIFRAPNGSGLIEIEAGVSQGDTVLLGSAQGITPGSRVRVLHEEAGR